MTSIMKLLGLDEMRNPWPREARHVALVGNPKCGKSTIAEMLVDEFGGVIVDDGLILRQAVPILFGIPAEDCFTQDGKAKIYNVCGVKDEAVRVMLGELGNYLEERYSPEFMPLRAMEEAQKNWPDAPFYIYPSCRREQGRTYRRGGGVVIQIDNPLVGPSGNVWDEWDRHCVDLTITNDPGVMGLDELREYIHAVPELLAAAR